MSGGGGTNTVVQSQPPQQFLDAYQRLVSSGQSLATQPQQQYGGPLVAGFTPQQQQAFSTIQNAQGLAQPYINAGAQLIGGSAAPITPNGLITGDQLSGLATQGLGYTGNAANTNIAGAGAPGVGLAQAAAGAGSGIAGAAGALANAAAGTDPSQVSRYFNPYLDSAVAATQAEFANQNAQTSQGLTSQAIKAGAFGGDRAGVAQGIAAGQEQLAQAPVIAGMESQGYAQAQQAMAQQEALQAQTALAGGNLGLAGSQLGANVGLGAANLGQQAAGQQGGLDLQAAQQLYGLFGSQQQAGLAGAQASGWLGENAGAMLAGLGSQSQNAALNGASANLQAGALQQQLGQEQLNVPYEQFLAQQAYPYQNLSFLAGLTTGAGSQAGGTSTTQLPSPSTLSQIGGLGLSGVGLAGATGGFGANGWLTSALAGSGALGGAAAGAGAAGAGEVAADALAFAKKGGRVGLASGGSVDVPDVSVTFIPGIGLVRGNGPPKGASPDKQDDPMKEGLATLQSANSLKGLFSGSSKAPVSGGTPAATTDSMWNAILSHPDTAGDYLASKFGGRARRAEGGDVPNYMNADPNTQAFAERLRGMAPEQLRELAVRTAPASQQGQMVRRAIQMQQMMPANDNQQVGLATGTYGGSGLALGGVAHMDAGGSSSGGGGKVSDAVAGFLNAHPGVNVSNFGEYFSPTVPQDLLEQVKAPQPPPTMSFTQGPRGIAIPQVNASVFAQPQGLEAGGGLPGWFNPMPQYTPAGTTTTTDSGVTTRQFPTFTTPASKSLTAGLTPPPPPPPDTTGNSNVTLTSDENDALKALADTQLRHDQMQKRGGRTGLADGGQPDDDDQGLPSAAIADTQPNTPDPHDAVDVKGGDREQMAMADQAPQGLAAAQPVGQAAPKQASGLDYVPKKPDPWMALLTAGLSIAGGKSPYALQNIGQGAMAGVKEYQHESELDDKPEVDHSGETVRIYYPSEKKWIDTGLPTNAAIQTKQTGEYQTGVLANQKDRNKALADEAAARTAEAAAMHAETARHNKAEEGIHSQQLEQGKFTAQPVKDAMGNPIGTNIIDNRTGKVTFQAADSAVRPANTADTSKTGDEFLKTIPAEAQPVVKAMVEGRQAPPSSFALSKPYWQQMMTYANQYDPGFDQTTWGARNKTRSAFSAGQEAKNVTALNTALQHAEVLDDSFDKLGNGSIPFLNAAKNWIKTEAGSAAPTNTKEAIHAVASEARKVFAGSGGGGLTELENWERSFPLNGSPDQQHGAMKQLVALMDSRLNALGDQYNRGMSKADDPVNLLSAEARKSYMKLTGQNPPEVTVGGQKGAAAEGASLPSFSDPSDPALKKLPSGSAFYAIGPNGQKMLKYVP